MARADLPRFGSIHAPPVDCFKDQTRLPLAFQTFFSRCAYADGYRRDRGGRLLDDSSTCNISRSIDLRVSAERVLIDHPLSLTWQVHGQDATRSNVQLASADEAGLEMIESMSPQGTRQMIFARPGLHTFTLTVVFQDGVRRSKQIRVRVEV